MTWASTCARPPLSLHANTLYNLDAGRTIPIGAYRLNPMKALHMVAFILLVVGGLNWLLVGLFSWDVGVLFGGMDALVSRAIYVLVGLSAIYQLFTYRNQMSGGTTSAPTSGGGGQPAM